MVFEPQTLAPGPGIGVQPMATFRPAPISTRFERFLSFSSINLRGRSWPPILNQSRAAGKGFRNLEPESLSR